MQEKEQNKENKHFKNSTSLVLKQNGEERQILQYQSLHHPQSPTGFVRQII